MGALSLLINILNSTKPFPANMFQVVSMEGCNMPGISRAHDLKEQSTRISRTQDLKERSDAQILEYRLVPSVRFCSSIGANKTHS